MDEKVRKWLFDIKFAIEEIDGYFENTSSDFKSYSGNIQLKRAVERDLEIIGEAVNRIIKTNPDFPIQNAIRIIGLRNQIIHAYDSISDENIWAIIQKHIPILKKQIRELLDK